MPKVTWHQGQAQNIQGEVHQQHAFAAVDQEFHANYDDLASLLKEPAQLFVL